MAIELGKAYVQVIPSAKGISGAISKGIMPEAEEAGNQAGEKTGKSLVSRLKDLVIASGIGQAIKQSISEGADLEQSLGGIETLYKGSADKMKQFANEAYKTAGLSANQYMEQVTSFSAGLIRSVGGDTAKAGDVANMAMIDMADNANKMGTSMQDIQNAYQGFAKQNYTMLDNLKLGYGGTQSEMKRLLADATKLTGVKYDINNLADVYSAINVIQGELGITGTTAKEANETFSGSFASMKASYQNLLGSITSGGGNIGSAIQGLADSAVTFAKNALPMLENIAKEAPTAIVQALTTAGPQLIEAGMNSLIVIIQGFANAMPTMIPQLTKVISDMVQVIVSNLPALIGAGSQLLTGIVQGLSEALPFLIEALPGIIQAVVTSIVENLPLIIEAGIQLLNALVQGLIQALPVIIEALPQIIQTILDGLLEALPLLIQAGIELFVALIQALPEIIATIVAALPQIINSIIAAIIQAIPLLIQAGVDLLIALIQNLPLIISTIVGALPQIISGIVNGLLSNIGKIIQAGVDLLIALIKNLPLIISEIVKAMPEIITGIVGALKDGISRIVEVGANLVRGLWDGIKGAAAWLWDKITGWISGIWDGIKGFFGIHSPSRKMAWIGEMISEGLAGGIEDNVKPVSKAMGLLEDAASGEFTSRFDATANFGWNGSNRSLPLDSSAGRSIVVNNYNQSPEPLTEREIARQTKISLQQLALGV